MRDAGRNQVLVGHEPVPGLDQAVFKALTYEITDGNHRRARLGGGIDIFHAFHLFEQNLQRRRHQFFDFFASSAGIFNQHVHYRHHDLRVFFARRERQCGGSRQQGNDQEQDGKLRGGKNFDYLSRQAASGGLLLQVVH